MNSCETKDCKFLINHNFEGIALASVSAGTLTLTDTPSGLECVARLDARSQQANDLASAISRGDMSTMSIGMRVSNDHWNRNFTERTINGLDKLMDVSCVNYAASPTTSISVAERMLAGMAPESRALLMKVVRQARSEIRSGKTISAATADKLHQALEGINVAGGHVNDLLDPNWAIEGDGAVSGGPGLFGAGVAPADGTGSFRSQIEQELSAIERERSEFNRSIAAADLRRLKEYREALRYN
jgi:HK97 family phage prohead protease